MTDARAAGYHVGLIFVPDDVELNVLRVGERVRLGGQSIPEKDIRRRYSRAIARSARSHQNAHQAAVYDNSSVSQIKLVEISHGRIAFNSLDRNKPTHCEIASAVGSALGIAQHEVFSVIKPEQATFW